MTEVLKKKNVLFISCFVVAAFCVISCDSKRNRNEIVRVPPPLKSKSLYQTRSAFCLHMEPKAGHDETVPLRYHKETKRCYRVGERGPCGEMMVFTIEDANYGVCDCDQSLRCGRPLIFWPPKNRCYYVYDQGPCREGKWLVFGFDLHPVCRRNPCLTEEIRLPSHDNRYWFSYKGKCYRTYTRGYCQEDKILFNMKTHFRPTCVESPECVIGPNKKVVSLACLPGQRMDFLGQCDREFRPLKPVSNTTDLHIIVTPRPVNLYCLFCKSSR